MLVLFSFLAIIIIIFYNYFFRRGSGKGKVGVAMAHTSCCTLARVTTHRMWCRAGGAP